MDMRRMAVPAQLQAFDYAGVTLNASLWERQQKDTLLLYLQHLDNDDVLHASRLRAGIATDARGMIGWGPSTGQYMGAYAKLYRATGDGRMREKALDLFHGWAACVDACPELLAEGTYLYEKLLGGLLDLYEFMGVTEAEAYVSRLTDMAIARFDTDIPRDGLQDHRMKGQIEWYTLPENLYRAYGLFANDKYRDFADAWRYDYLYEHVRKGTFDQIGPRHAYSHVNVLSSVLRDYMVHGDPRVLAVATKAYDELTAHHTYATGGYGPAETLYGEHPGYLGEALLSPFDFRERAQNITYRNFAGQTVARSEAWGSCEVSCCAWAVFKLCHYLLQLTGEARFGAWAERMLVNGTGGQPPITPEGKVLYYADYFVDGALKSTEDRRLFPMGQNFQWQCCTGTFPQDVAEYNNMLYYHTEDALFISQYLPATVQVVLGGKAVRVEALADFPQEQRLRFVVHVEEPATFSLCVRVPQWAQPQSTVSINGEIQTLTLTPDTWLRMERLWREGDSVLMELPYAMRFVPVDAEHPDIVALTWGPLVLASTEMTVLVGDVQQPEAWIVPVADAVGTFETLPGHAGIYPFVQRRFVPYYTIGEMQWYYLYNRIYPDMEALARG